MTRGLCCAETDNYSRVLVLLFYKTKLLLLCYDIIILLLWGTIGTKTKAHSLAQLAVLYYHTRYISIDIVSIVVQYRV